MLRLQRLGCRCRCRSTQQTVALAAQQPVHQRRHVHCAPSQMYGGSASYQRLTGQASASVLPEALSSTQVQHMQQQEQLVEECSVGNWRSPLDIGTLGSRHHSASNGNHHSLSSSTNTSSSTGTTTFTPTSPQSGISPAAPRHVGHASNMHGAEQLPRRRQHGAVVALGKFDALHRGHRTLAVQAAAMGGTPVLLSFSGMAEVLGWPLRLPLVAACDRARVLNSWTDACMGRSPRLRYIPFHEIRRMPPAEFVDVLAKDLRAAGAVAGSNYRFGFKAAGDAAALQQLGAAAGMEISIMDLLSSSHEGRGVQQAQVSSSLIRELLQQQDMERVAQHLGRPYRLVCDLDNSSATMSLRRLDQVEAAGCSTSSSISSNAGSGSRSSSPHGSTHTVHDNDAHGNNETGISMTGSLGTDVPTTSSEVNSSHENGITSSRSTSTSSRHSANWLAPVESWVNQGVAPGRYAVQVGCASEQEVDGAGCHYTLPHRLPWSGVVTVSSAGVELPDSAICAVHETRYIALDFIKLV